MTLRNAAVFVLLVVLYTVGSIPRSFAQGHGPGFRPDAALERLQRERGPVRSRVDGETGGVRFVQGRLGRGAPAAAEQAARQFFARYGDLFGIADAAAELVVRAVDRDPRGYTSVRFEQRIGGVRVMGGDIRAEIDAAGLLHTVHGQLLPQPLPPGTSPRLTASRAIELAQQATAAPSRAQRPAELVVARSSGVDRLAWRVVLLTGEPARWEIMVDAMGGTLVDRRDTLRTTKQRRTYSAGLSPYLPGTLLRRESDPPTGDAHADAAHDNAGTAYDFFWRSFGRDSIDGNGGLIESTVHYAPTGADGQPLPYTNPFGDGSQLVYGDGDGQLFAPLAMSLDVVAHELTHGVTGATAGLAYQNQSGALDEAFSDIFAALIDGDDWEIGEDVYTPGTAGDALRSLAEPGRYDQPTVWGEYLVTPNTAAGDQGGVHRNSGIINHVAYRTANAIGRVKMGQIFYRTLTMKLTSGSDFADARDLAIQSCSELIGSFEITADDCRAVQTAFAAAGLGDYPPAQPGLSFTAYLPLASHIATDCGRELLRNRGFEAGAEGWPNTGGMIGAWALDEAERASAKLNMADQMLQLVALPPAAGRLTLSLNVYKSPGAEDNRLEIGLEDPQTRALLVPATSFGTGIATGSWQPVSVVLEGAAGRSPVRLVIRHIASGTSKAFTYIDDLQLSMSCAG